MQAKDVSSREAGQGRALSQMGDSLDTWLKELDRKEDFDPLDETISRFAQEVKKRGVVVFAGAGLSVPSPCSCPTWEGLKREILAKFMDKLLKENWPIRNYLLGVKDSLLQMKMRPETFFWALTSDVGFSTANDIVGGIDLSTPNSNHYAINSLTRAGFIKGIITTNFDTYIERCSINADYFVIRDEEEIRDFLIRKRGSISFSKLKEFLIKKNKGIPVFKPHGCLSKPSSLMYRIDDIQTLNTMKKELLRKLLTRSPVLVLGYSGNDEDIFPHLQESLESSKYHSLICIHRPSDEPIQRWDITRSPNIERIVGDSETVMSNLVISLGEEVTNRNQLVNQDPNTPLWKINLSLHVEKIPHDIIAFTLSHLCSLNGNHRRALSFADLAQDICEDTDLSTCPDKSLRFIMELQARARKELAQNDLAIAQQGTRIGMILRGENLEELISAFLDRAHVALRSNNLDAAEIDIGLAEEYVRQIVPEKEEIEPESAPILFMQYLWYLGILRRKQSRVDEADTVFDQAIAIAHAKDDIIHGCRILLDYALVRCQAASLKCNPMDIAQEYEKAQQIWDLSVWLAERANDWDTAGKAAKNRGILLSLSDKPYLGRPELERALRFFERSSNIDGINRTKEALNYSESELLQVFMSFSRL